jgi:hypothetical protein
MREITISTSALAELIDCFPNPEDPEPIGPWGPVIRLLDLVSLNPQPLPPAGGPEIGTALRRGTTWGGQPEPWVWARLESPTGSTVLTDHTD